MQSRKAASVFMQMGLMLSQRGVSMHINPLEEADEMFKVLNEALLRAEVEGFDKDRLDREERDREAQRRHEIDLIRAQNTVREESDQTRTINSNGNAGNVTINETPRPASSSAQGKKFCSECGAELKPGAKFCNECGTKA
jgi:hypothetical protein